MQWVFGEKQGIAELKINEMKKTTAVEDQMRINSYGDWSNTVSRARIKLSLCITCHLARTVVPLNIHLTIEPSRQAHVL